MIAETESNRPTVAKALRLLVVEDEMMIAMLLEDLLKSYGYDIVGPVSSVSKAIKIASREAIDGAILDLNVGNQTVYPVAEALAARGIPFLFVTGYNAAAIIDKFRHCLALQKPFKPQTLKFALLSLLKPTGECKT